MEENIGVSLKNLPVKSIPAAGDRVILDTPEGPQVANSEYFINNKTYNTTDSSGNVEIASDVDQKIDKVTGGNVNYREVTKFADGTPMTDEKADGRIYTKKDGKYYRRAVDVITPEMFGALGGENDDTGAFMKLAAFVNSLPDDRKALNAAWEDKLTYTRNAIQIEGNNPDGYTIKDTFYIETPCNIYLPKLFWRGAKDRTAIYIKDAWKNNITIDVSSDVNVNYNNDNHQGIVIDCARYCDLDLGASFFTKGIVFFDGRANGCAWNMCRLRLLKNNLHSFVIRAINGGWCNGNHIIDGEFSAEPAVVPTTIPGGIRTFFKFETDGTGYFDSWLIENPHFEEKMAGAETLCFDFSAKAVLNIKFLEPRVEMVNPNRIGKLHRDSQYFSFETTQWCDVRRYTDENDRYYIRDEEKIADTGRLAGDFKQSYIKYVRKTDSWNFADGIGVNRWVDNYHLQLLKFSEACTIDVETGTELEIALFDKNMQLIKDAVILNKQVDWISAVHTNYAVREKSENTGVKTIVFWATEVNRHRVPVVPEAAYLGIIIPAGEQRAFAKVYIDEADRHKVAPFKYYSGIPENAYVLPVNPSVMQNALLVRGEQYYGLWDAVLFTITKSGKLDDTYDVVMTGNGVKDSNILTVNDSSYVSPGMVLNIENLWGKYIVSDVNGLNLILNRKLNIDCPGYYVRPDKPEWTTEVDKYVTKAQYDAILVKDPNTIYYVSP